MIAICKSAASALDVAPLACFDHVSSCSKGGELDRDEAQLIFSRWPHAKTIESSSSEMSTWAMRNDVRVRARWIVILLLGVGRGPDYVKSCA